jgi:predicted GH43/DUF377 family glycosyl hydrolase
MNELGIFKRQPKRFYANHKRVLGQYFDISDERAAKIISRILTLSPTQVEQNVEQVLAKFESRHRDFQKILMKNFKRVSKLAPAETNFTTEQKVLIGAYFTNEYSVEAAALFNPSMVAHPDQSGLAPDQLRYVMSLRATGEGHISSLAFSQGVIEANGGISPEPISTFATHPNMAEIDGDASKFQFSQQTELSERTVFPLTPDESNGIEDVRLAKFRDDNGEETYYGTYTAYDGQKIQSKILQTNDFLSFKSRPLTGPVAQNKGMALFPKKINGRYAMISRQDGENIFLMYSDDLYSWHNSTPLQEPNLPWEFVQLGNCGSPIETDAGWILLSHSVGPMRSYHISAYLLQKDDPSKVIGYLPQPLISPNESEREGYVPNVVYSCGGLIHRDNVVVPYAMSDYACGFGVVDVEMLLQKMN